MDEEERRIAQNKKLTFVDRCDAARSARSLSKKIEGMIRGEKEKLSEFYDS